MDVTAVRLFVMAVAGWWADQRQASVAYLIEGNPYYPKIQPSAQSGDAEARTNKLGR